LALLLALVVAATWKLTLGQRIIARGDLLLYFYPLRDYASAAIRQGYLPLWNPFTFMGAPFLANSQVGFFYPFNVLTAWVPVGQAVAWNIVLHLLVAAGGMYLLAWRGLRLSVLAAFASAIAFGLGGYLGAQVEHLNQLQVLAWLPLELLVIGVGASQLRFSLPRLLLLSLLIALQALAGHTQSLYICLVALGIVFVVQGVGLVLARLRQPNSRPSWVTLVRSWAAPVLLLALAGALAVLISALQLLPTVELASQSARSGGLPFNEVGSFSWRPWVIARALLPTYGDPLFAEYVAYLGMAGLALALLGAIATLFPSQSTRPSSDAPNIALSSNSGQWLALVLTVSGAILALGVATSLFNLLYRFLPGFNFFRAQARWLVVFALGAAMLIGYGVQSLQNGLTRAQKRVWLFGWLAWVLLLIAGLWVGARFSPEAEYRQLPVLPVLVGWLVSMLVTTLLILLVQWQRALQLTSSGLLLVVALVVELGVASQMQPYARAADEQALTDLRPSTAHLLAGATEDRATSASPARVLALSGLFFDPGDLPEQTLIYQPQLTPDELYDRIIASKQKEVLSPNLSLYYRLPSVDGYDGGLLPLKRYADFVQPFTQPISNTARSIDGRLRETLQRVPNNAWLEKMAVKYIITDKTRDVFIDNIYYDLQIEQPLSAGISLPLIPFTSTALGLVLSAPGHQTGAVLAQVNVEGDNPSNASPETFMLRATDAMTQPYFHIALHLNQPRSPARLRITQVNGNVTLLGLSSIDERTNAFLAQPVRGDHDLRLVHSGDVKIYANQRPAPRAFLAALADCSAVNGELQVNTSATEAQASSTQQVTFVRDTPEQVVLRVQADVPGWLVLRDAYYPGWVARIDGNEAPISSADTLFRAIQVLPGTHEVAFSYAPASVRYGAVLSGLGILTWAALVLLALWRGARARQRVNS
jgi:hypothetical protein